MDINDDGTIDITKADIRMNWDIAIPVHLYGYPAVVPENSIRPVIEDAAQAHGLKIRGRVQCFSFYPTKNLGAIGQAGAVVTNDKDIADMCRRLREYGETSRFVYDHHLWRIGGNFRIDELQAAILRVKLKYLDRWNAKRRQIAEIYRQGLKGLEPAIRLLPDHPHHSYHIFAIMCKQRNELSAFLNKHGIQTSVRYPVPIHLQPALRYLGLKKGDFPKAEVWCDEVLTLPIYPELSPNRVELVVKLIHDWVEECA